MNITLKKQVEELKKNCYFLHLIPEIDQWIHDYEINPVNTRDAILRNHLLSLKQAPYFLDVN